MLEMSSVEEGQSGFGKRYTVDVHKRLPEFDTPGGIAFMVTDSEKPELPLYAFVQSPNVPVRASELKELKKDKIPGLVCPHDYGVMTLSLETKVERLVIIFDRPLGGSLFVVQRCNKRLTVATLRGAVPLSFAHTLALLHNRNIKHRQIRPEKLFFMTDGGGEPEIVLGECVTVPQGYGMPIDLEPIEVMFADPPSRGDATVAADMYQMGVTLLCYFKNRPVWEKRDKAKSFQSRTQFGSYSSLAQGEGIAGSLVDLIKGLMHDEIENRWDIADVLNWFEGGKKRAVPSRRNWSLNRSVLFIGQSYADRRVLADAFASHPKEAIIFLKNLDFSSWIANTIRSEVMEERVEALVAVNSEEDVVVTTLTKQDYALLSRVCAHLHPGGPIRYKGLSIQVDSLAATLPVVLKSESKEQYEALKMILSDKFLTALAEIIGERDMGFYNHVAMIKKSTGTAQSGTLGRGLERVLYNLNREMPCVSSKFTNLWIDNAGKFAMALNRSSNRDFIRTAIFDPHVAAYLASRNEIYARVINNFSITENDPSRFAILALDFFGNLQKEYQLPVMNHLTNLLIEGLRATVNELRNKKQREKVKTVLDKLKQGGDISKLTAQLDIGKIQAIDKQGFVRARAAVFGIDRQRKHLMHKFTHHDFHSKLMGYKWIRAVAFLIFIGSIFITIR